MIIQYFSFAMKEISKIYLYYRLEHNLYYDDISFCYIMTILMEYTFVYEYVLIQDYSYFQKSVAIFNFVAIQTQNITNINIFYQIYYHFKKHNFKMLKGLVVFQYFILFSLGIYQLISMFLADLYILIIMILVTTIA